MRIGRAQNLTTYRMAHQTAMGLFRDSKRWPREERYALTDQVRRSSRSVCANLAEAWRKRRYPKHFVSKLSDADSEAEETVVWSDFARDCAYLDPPTAAAAKQQCREVAGGLVKMMRNPSQWCTTPRG